MSWIAVEGMEFHSYHGCFKEERIIGTRFEVSLWFEYDTKNAEESDNLNDTIDYQKVFQLVKLEMEQSSHLLEHVARRILNSFHSTYAEVKRSKVKVSKLNPPLGGKMNCVSVTLENE
ncbi:MAG: dihydroneopterin aldolase [Bacteroidetes bacterium]|nr:dihydroneopterin aldolase [Bacteroidota bacterium]